MPYEYCYHISQISTITSVQYSLGLDAVTGVLAHLSVSRCSREFDVRPPGARRCSSMRGYGTSLVGNHHVYNGAYGDDSSAAEDARRVQLYMRKV